MVEVQTDPAEVGFDAARLARIDDVLGRYVDDGRLAGWQVVVGRHGRTVHSSVRGMRDLEAGLPVEQDTLWRIYSMTKPITSVVAMQLFEEGAYSLNDPISRWLPEFEDMRVFKGGTPAQPQTVHAAEPIRVWHLLSHTSGLTYGFLHSGPVDEMYRNAGAEFNPPVSLEEACALWASLPLQFEPGTAWGYSVATDVLGRLIEVVTGQTLEEAFAERVLGPLGMTDTTWWVEPERQDRLAALYVPNPADGGRAVRYDAFGKGALHPPKMLSGGGGLVSTAADYERFTRMLLQGGELDGARLLGTRTLAYMGRNHLPGGGLLPTLGRGQFAETAYDGIGFGLGFGVLEDPVALKVHASRGEMTWGGLASTAFWVDAAEGITVGFYTQLMPSSTYPVRGQLRQLVYSALVD
ncbi:MAG: serine hydrolase [Frankiales bacterium]|nr:serine hydrolase [Frankiales bacterium]